MCSHALRVLRLSILVFKNFVSALNSVIAINFVGDNGEFRHIALSFKESSKF